jgi:hypothetical protein
LQPDETAKWDTHKASVKKAKNDIIACLDKIDKHGIPLAVSYVSLMGFLCCLCGVFAG